jgi:Cytotoxic translational repressor of toxin-antitoxin stability system
VAEPYRITVAPSASKEIEALPAPLAQRVAGKIDALALNPRPPGTKKLEGEPLWRIRVGDYRIVYAIDDSAGIVDISRVRHRSKVYKAL